VCPGRPPAPACCDTLGGLQDELLLLLLLPAAANAAAALVNLRLHHLLPVKLLLQLALRIVAADSVGSLGSSGCSAADDCRTASC
jgi:hypothetical protein